MGADHDGQQPSTFPLAAVATSFPPSLRHFDIDGRSIVAAAELPCVQLHAATAGLDQGIPCRREGDHHEEPAISGREDDAVLQLLTRDRGPRQVEPEYGSRDALHVSPTAEGANAEPFKLQTAAAVGSREHPCHRVLQDVEP